tara:strand:- start:163 stop:1206 length:1044 start_codon:yes stop_codon:yes gene_type:complete
MATIPDLTRAVDTIFTTTWFEMQKKATDNILNSNVVLAALREAGCFKKQDGQKYVERTIRYGTKTAVAVAKGDTLPTGEDEIETAGFWDWKYITVHVQRSLQDDQQNSGAGKIKSLVQTKINAARDALEQKFDDAIVAAIDTDNDAGQGTELRASRDPYSLFNFLPGTSGTYFAATPGTYTYGKVDTGTGNPWWNAKYNEGATSPALMNMKDEMRTMYNNCHLGAKSKVDLIITDQTRFEAYEDLCSAEIQKVQDVGSMTAQLGYEVLRYKGAKVVFSENSSWPSGVLAFLNTDWIDCVYDPNMWFTMTPWDTLPNQFERISRIVCTFTGPICYQLRRQGFLGTYSS